MKKRLNTHGFTLIEILMVVIIIGVLAGLAIPIYSSTTEKARKQEAYQTLAAVRESQLRYRSANASYATAYTQLDYDPTNTANDPPGMSRHFTYAVPTASASTWSLVATRNTVDSGNATNTLTIDQTGTITSNY